MKKAITIILEKVKAGTMEVDEAITLISGLTGGQKDIKDEVDSIIKSFESKAKDFFADASKNTDEWVEFSKKAVGSLRKDLDEFLKRNNPKSDDSGNEKDGPGHS
jgi:hypothetical protein